MLRYHKIQKLILNYNNLIRNIANDSKLLIANRGEIACRIAKTAQKLEIKTVGIFSDADVKSRHLKYCDESVNIGLSEANKSYLNKEKIIETAEKLGCFAIHPGYGFLSERHEFAKVCEEKGIIFVGPSAESIRAMGDKREARKIMIKAGVPVVPGYEGKEQEIEVLMEEAKKIGFPVLIKASMGGGGKGMKLVNDKSELKEAILSAKREAMSSFGNDNLIIEKYIKESRHIEVQIFGDTYGNIIHLLERDCSIQRRHQKIIEECPAPNLTDDLRHDMHNAALAAAQAVNYTNAGTVEFIYDLSSHNFYFMEMNTRLQVEHPVTEWVCGIDLVEWQLKIAAGQPLPLLQKDIKANGYAIESRIYAENPELNFLPGAGKIEYWNIPFERLEFEINDNYKGIRIDSGVEMGDVVGTYYDPMIAKVVACDHSRKKSISRLISALSQIQICGPAMNVNFILRCLNRKEFKNGEFSTLFIEQYKNDLLSPSKLNNNILIIACICYLKQMINLNQNIMFGPWSIPDGKRINHELIMNLCPIFQNEKLSVNLIFQSENEFEAIFENNKIKIKNFKIDKNEFEGNFEGIRMKGQHIHIKTNKGKKTIIFTSNENSEFTWEEDKFKIKEEENLNNNTLKSPIPGKIIKILIKEGEEVVKDQDLIILEAMKMEHVLKSPCSGKIKNLSIYINNLVTENQKLLEIQLK